MGRVTVPGDSPKARGDGRAAFVRHLPAIRREIASGEYLTVIYARRAAALGITYSAFRKLVSRHAEDAKPVRRRPYGSGKAPFAPPPVPVPALPTAPPRPAATRSAVADGGSDARHEPSPATPAGRPGFRHDPRTKEGEPERLLGPGFLGDRRR